MSRRLRRPSEASHPSASPPELEPIVDRRLDVIPVAEPLLGAAERDAVLAVLASGVVSSASPVVAEFEAALAGVCGARGAVATSSGTHALDLLLYAFDLRPGDEVVVPAFTFISVGACVVRAGARPVYVDVDRASLNIDADAVRAAIGPRTRGIIGVHTYGHPCAMGPLRTLAAERDLFLIEDACEALGAADGEHPVGSLGTAAVHSFYANKMLTTGNGGAITSDDADLLALLRDLRGYSYESGRLYWHRHMPFNVRMSGLQAAIGRAQIDRLPQVVAHRTWLAAEYATRLADIPGLVLPSHPVEGRHAWWMFTIHVEPTERGASADEVRRELAAQGIETRRAFVPLHHQPVLLEATSDRQGPFPNAEWAAATGVNLPSGAGLGESEIDRVARALRGVQARGGRP